MAKIKIDNSKNDSLKEVYTDALGNKWYCLTDLLAISPSRGLSAARAERYASLKVDETNFKALLNNAIDGINKEQNLVNAIGILNELKIRSEFMVEEQSVLDLAAIYYFLQDEDPLFPSEHHNTMKRDIWAKDKKCADFFLHMGIGLTKLFSDMPAEDLLKFIRETTMHAERIFRYIPRT